MKQRYNKTTWIDGSTPIDAEKLNKIENAIDHLYTQTLTVSDITGDGIIKPTTVEGEDGDMKLKLGFKNFIETVLEENLENTILDSNHLYLVVTPGEEGEDGTIKKIIFGGNTYVLG